MALSSYKSPKSPFNRSRSSSSSSPIRNRIVYQEIYSLGTNTLLRSYSCDQVFDKDASGRTFQTTQLHVLSFISPEKKINKKQVENKRKEPRRLALQFHTDKSNIQKKEAKTKKRPRVLLTGLKKTMIFSLLTITSACAIYYVLFYKECSHVWDLEKTETDLKTSIFGQEQALTKINNVLKTCNNVSDIHVMVFAGGVGVGKTYASSIISRNFPWSSKVLIPYSEYFTADVDKLLQRKLLTCGCNLVIVDDLSFKTVTEAINLIALLNNKHKANENLLVILIFQATSESDRNGIITEFKNTYMNVYHVPFKPLTKDVVEKCFNLEIQRQSVKVSNSELKKLVEDKMKHIDIVKGPSGCKGVSDEVASFFKKYDAF